MYDPIIADLRRDCKGALSVRRGGQLSRRESLLEQTAQPPSADTIPYPSAGGGRLHGAWRKRQAWATRELCERRAGWNKAYTRVHRFEPKLTYKTPLPRDSAARAMSARTISFGTGATSTRAQLQRSHQPRWRERVKGRRPLRVQGSARPPEAPVMAYSLHSSLASSSTT